MTEPETGILLIDKIRKGNREALSELYDSYSAIVYGLAMKMTGIESFAQDIVQDVFLHIWKNADKFNASKDRLSTWIIGITRNRGIEEIRSESFKNRTQNTEVVIPRRVARTNSTMNANGLKIMNKQLRPEQKRLLEYLYFDALSFEEAAKVLNIPLGTVKTRIRSIILELR